MRALLLSVSLFIAVIAVGARQASPPHQPRLGYAALTGFCLGGVLMALWSLPRLKLARRPEVAVSPEAPVMGDDGPDSLGG
jgi:hypothetical protein